jgi:hypothetical protein
MEINYKIPVSLFDYRESENPLYSFAKLKIFYVGMTPDKRLFTKKFSDQLLRTLPYVPVVGYYSDEKDDFVGHNSKVQHIYGVVPEDAKVEYVKENGREYAVCDVILYTGRNDDTGQIAQKIVGKAHSLELNPGDTTYQINHSMDGRLESIEFLTGSLLGLSVLGDDEQPAFTGSEFFKEFKQLFSKDVLNSMNDFYRNTPCTFANKKNFARDSYEHRKTRAYNALKEMYPNVRYDIIQMTDDFIFYCEYVQDQNGTQKIHYKINYTDNGRIMELVGGPEEVYETYLTEEELDMLDSYEPADELDYKTLQDLDLKPTESMAGNANRGLELRREHGRGGTAVGVARARDISNRKNLSPQTVGRMYSYFSRHEVDKKGKGWNSGEEGYPSNGLIAWLLWGGDSGYTWATSKWNQIKKIRENMSLEHDNVEVKLLEENKELLQEQELDVSNATEIVDDRTEMEYPKEEDKDMEYPKEDEEMVKQDSEEDKDMEYPKEDEDKEPEQEMSAEEEEVKEEEMELSGTENNTDGAGGEFEQEETQDADQESQEGQEFNSSSLIDSEREELNALRQEVSEYRRIKKLDLLESFKDDLSKTFLDNLIGTIDKYTFDELEVLLSKEFTRISKEQKQQSSKFKPLQYSGDNNNNKVSTNENKADVVKRLVEQLK